MSEPVWMRDPEGVWAYVPAEEVDAWRPRGAVPVDGHPTEAGDFVWMAHSDLDAPARIAWGGRDYWVAKGFEPSPPPAPVDLTKDPVLDDVPEEKPEPAKKATKPNLAAKPATEPKE